MSEKLVFNRKQFQTYLNNLSKITDNAILDIDDDTVSTIVSSEDRSLFLWSTLKGDFDSKMTLNLPSIRKLSKILDLVGGNNITFIVNSNHLEYRGNTKFKYHLFDDGILTRPKLSLAKIKSLKCDTNFEITKSFVKDLLKTSSIFNQTKKLYISTKDDQLWWSIGDKTVTNSDVFTFSSGDVDFEMDEFILKLENLSLLSFGEDDIISVKIDKIGIGNFYSESDTITLNYITSSLTK